MSGSSFSSRSVSSGRSETARDLFIVGARNAHAVEKEAAQIIERQLDRLQNYPEMAQRLRQHLTETHQQEERLDRILESLDESSSALKDTVMGLMGNMAALAHAPADDEILKNTFANLAFENYEIAAYKSLIAIGEAAGMSQAVPLLRQSLQEEENMARFIDENVEMVTRMHLEMKERGEKADR
jgi:ferritin-like metal-binding protein YciE